MEANRGGVWILDADIRSCFDQIEHDALIAQVERRVPDRQMLKLLRAWLRCGILHEGVVTDPVAGTPQGSPLSPLLANIALHIVDVEWERTSKSLGVLVRFADDLVVLCRSRVRAEEARRRIERILVTVGLRLHPDKTRIVHIGDGSDGFDFLGFHHRLREVSGSPVSAQIALPAGHGLDRHGNSGRKFVAVDSYVHERLAKLASVKYGIRGRRLASRHSYRWITSLGVYRLTGNIQWWRPAHATR